MNTSSPIRWTNLLVLSSVALACSVPQNETPGAVDESAGGRSGEAVSDPGGGGAAGASERCTWGGYGGADPHPVPLTCAKSFWAPAYATLQSSAILLTVEWCGPCNALCDKSGDVSNATITADEGWATVTDSSSSSCKAVLLEPRNGATEGDITFTATVSGLDQCHRPLTCPISNRYHVSAGGEVTPIEPTQ